MSATARRRRRDAGDLAPQSLTRKQVIDLLRKNKPITGADLRGTDLSGLSFDGVDLAFCKLADADLTRCSFRGANLSNVSLWHANLKDCSFEDAVLDFADLDCANIDGCTFKGARLKKTILPNPRKSLDQVHESVLTGRRIALKPEDDDFE